MQNKPLAYDVETTGLRPHHGDDMFSYSTSDADLNTFVQRLDGSKLRRIQGRKRLDALWSDFSSAKIMHNAKFDLTFTEKFLGRRLDKNKTHCTHKMSHILQNNHYQHSLDQLAWELAEYPKIDAQVRKMAKALGGSYQKVPERHMTLYQRLDAERTMMLFLFFYPKIKANPQWLEIYETEMELIWTTMRMEGRGIMVDVPTTRNLIIELEEEVERLRQGIFAQAGKRFNPDSDDQLRKLLFDKYNLPVYKKTKKTKRPSVDKFALMQLREEFNLPILNMILKMRSWSKGIKMVGSYIDLSRSDGILHPTINTCAAKTSRESSEHPNLQNVQKTGVLLNPFSVPARKAFRPRPGHINLHIDYAGIEMRLLVEVSGDPKMTICLRDGDGDVHSLAAEIFYLERFKKAKGRERETLRAAAKGANFAAPYGAGAQKITQTLGLSGEKGIAAFRRYRDTFPTLVGLSRIISTRVREYGFVVTSFGRKLSVPRDKAYMGTNYLIQGTAAGVIKRAQNQVHKYNEEATGGEVKILFPIHDEIVIEYPRNRMGDLQNYLRDVHKIMLDFPMFKVPLDVEVSVTTSNWENKRKIKIAA